MKTRYEVYKVWQSGEEMCAGHFSKIKEAAALISRIENQGCVARVEKVQVSGIVTYGGE